MSDENQEQHCKDIIDVLKKSSRDKKFKLTCKTILFESDQDAHKKLMDDIRDNLDPKDYLTSIGMTSRQYQSLERKLSSESDFQINYKLLEKVFRHDLRIFYNYVTRMVENSNCELFLRLYNAACEEDSSLNYNPVQVAEQDDFPIQEEGERHGPIPEVIPEVHSVDERQSIPTEEENRRINGEKCFSE